VGGGRERRTSQVGFRVRLKRGTFKKVRFYLVPKQGVGTFAAPFKPKYIPELGVRWSGMDYGGDAPYLVAADVTPEQHLLLVANLDVTTIPQNLDSLIGVALPTVQQVLEDWRIPAGWINGTHSYRQVLRVVSTLFALMQRFNGLHWRSFWEAGITLNTLVSDLTVAQRQALLDAATSFNLDTSGITGTMTIRQAFKLLVDQRQVNLAGEVF
jgi:hypothetical protein